MIGSFQSKALRFCVAFIALIGSTAGYTVAQSAPKPYLQPIVIQPGAKAPVYPTPAPTPLVKKTGSSSPVAADIVNPSDVVLPGVSGILVETLDGKVVRENSANFAYNPASNVKIATAFAVIKTFGHDYRFPTNVFTDGEIDRVTGVLNGNLYVSGRDPVFNLEHGVALAEALNRNGIRSVNGDLVVVGGFIMSMNASTQASAGNLFATLDAGRRSAAAGRAWQNYLAASGKLGQVQSIPSVNFTGKMYVDIIPTNAKLLFVHESTPLKEIVKITLCYSNNFLAERLGDMLGGAYAVARTVQREAGIAPEQFVLETSSGLGINRVTPRAMMRLLHAFRDDLARRKMTFADVMPIAGVDPGTLEKRFTEGYSRGSVVAKTGTLGTTDGGASSLSGEMQTKNGKLLFVIFNQRGNNSRFRTFQNAYVTSIQNQFGGAMPLGYSTSAIAQRMANTRITYPDVRSRRSE